MSISTHLPTRRPKALDFIRRYREFAAGAEAAVAEPFRRAFGMDAGAGAMRNPPS